LFFGPDLLNTFVEGDSNFGFRNAESGFGGDVNGAVSADGGMFATETSNTQTEGFADFLSFGVSAVLGEVGQLDVDRGSHTGTHIGGARGDNTEIGRFGAATGDQFFDNIDGSLESVKDVVDADGFFHGHDSQVVFFADPDDETFVSRDVAASAVGPVTGDTGSDQIAVVSHVFEHDVGFDQFLVSFIGDVVGVTGGQRDIFATKVGVGNQFVEDGFHGQFHVLSVFAGHGAGQRKFVQVSGSPDSHGQSTQTESGDIKFTVSGQTFDAFQVPVVDVFSFGQVDFVVFFQSGFEKVVELVVVGGVHGITTHARFRVLDTRVATSQKLFLVIFGQRVEVLVIKGSGHDVVRVGTFDFVDLIDGHFSRVFRV